MTSPEEGVTVFTSPYLNAGAHGPGEVKGLMKKYYYFKNVNNVVFVDRNNNNFQIKTENDFNSFIMYKRLKEENIKYRERILKNKRFAILFEHRLKNYFN